ncbi:peptide-methionine (S)-S-oxide reductase [Spongiimicrobium salis]|uniref:peptide-methionine (S)-S-oxide reductase n=1 Tax=Spongiimicrobium salis TaxID=1667022 RepID=UPI00374CCD49
MEPKVKIAFGGGCHWCTEAVFQSLKGVYKVEQGFVSSYGNAASFSEAVIVYYDPNLIDLEVLTEIHLHTHKSTVQHRMRTKYRSAIYTFTPKQFAEALKILKDLQPKFDHQIITEVLDFKAFKPSEEQFQNYYAQNPQKPFCERYIAPKLHLLQKEYQQYTET